MNYIVLFSREVNDEAVADPDSIPSHRWQMLAEFREADPNLKLTVLGNTTANDEYIVFAAVVEHDRDYESLSARLQKAYDDYGVSGFYQIVGTGDNMVPLP